MHLSRLESISVIYLIWQIYGIAWHIRVLQLVNILKLLNHINRSGGDE